MDKSWQEWVDENIARNVNTVEMVEILQKNDFKLPIIKKMMGKHFPNDSGEAQQASPAAPASAATASGFANPKYVSLIEMLRKLASLNPKKGTIERRSGVSGAEFLEKYYAANQPVILCGLMDFWEAPHKWTPEYLKATCGNEIVEIMASRETNPEYEIEGESHKREVKFSEFVDMVTGGGESNDYYLTARNAFFTRPGVAPLRRDIEIFTEYLKETDGQGMYMWYGPKGTITPLHHDTMNIFMAQVKGRKQIKLIPACEIDLVYNHFAVYSQVDSNNPDYARFPKYRDASVIDLELAPGEVLFIPVGWWHSVKSLDESITVSLNNFLFPNEFAWEHPAGASKAAAGY